MNKYAAIIKIKGTNNYIHAGFKEGLQVNYSIQTSNGKDQSDIITITMTETSKNGITIGNFPEEINSGKRWRYVSKVGNKKAYDCVSGGVAKYLLQEECDYFGNPTGNYKVLSGYANWFNNLNITGTFSDVVTFNSPDCTYERIAEYRWVNTSGYECSGTTKMTRQKEQVSFDSGSTWSDIIPLNTRASLPVIQYNSPDCGYTPPPQYRWVTVSGSYQCSGTTKMTQEKQQVSHDSGSTWTDVVPLVTRAALPVIEYDSTDCGGGEPTENITVSFSVTNRSSSPISGAVEVFWENMSNSFTITIPSSIDPGITENIGSATISEDASFKQIVAAYLENPSVGSAALYVTSSRTLIDGGNYNLEYNPI